MFHFMFLTGTEVVSSQQWGWDERGLFGDVQIRPLAEHTVAPDIHLPSICGGGGEDVSQASDTTDSKLRHTSNT